MVGGITGLSQRVSTPLSCCATAPSGVWLHFRSEQGARFSLEKRERLTSYFARSWGALPLWGGTAY
jgi:hypothetical protein